MRHAARIAQLGDEAAAALRDESIARASAAVRSAAELDPRLAVLAAKLDGIVQELADSTAELRLHTDALEADPRRLEAIESRLSVLDGIKRKYGGSIGAALEHLARAEDRLRQIETSGEREKELHREVMAARERYLDRARKLHKERVRAAKKFEEAIEKVGELPEADQAELVAAEVIAQQDGPGLGPGAVLAPGGKGVVVDHPDRLGQGVHRHRVGCHN